MVRRRVCDVCACLCGEPNYGVGLWGVGGVRGYALNGGLCACVWSVVCAKVGVRVWGGVTVALCTMVVVGAAVLDGETRVWCLGVCVGA